jgi:formamidopyrimidine-DNA glycosylase
MPELPEVETIVRDLRPTLVGRSLVSAAVSWPRTVAGTGPEDFSARIAGQRIERLDRRAKYLVFGLSADHLLVHLKMTGRLYVAWPGEEKEADRWLRVVFGLDDGRELRFSDSRKFGRVYLIDDAEQVTGRLGPEPLADTFTPEAFLARIGTRSGMAKPLLLNQEFIAGIGNIYADEALWLAQIDPRRKVDTLKLPEAERLYHALRRVLHDGIAHQGSSVSWYRRPDGTTGEHQDHFNVYDRQDRPCPRCGTPVCKIWLGQRGTHFCPVCQG